MNVAPKVPCIWWPKRLATDPEPCHCFAQSQTMFEWQWHNEQEKRWTPLLLREQEKEEERIRKAYKHATQKARVPNALDCCRVARVRKLNVSTTVIALIASILFMRLHLWISVNGSAIIRYTILKVQLRKVHATRLFAGSHSRHTEKNQNGQRRWMMKMSRWANFMQSMRTKKQRERKGQVASRCELAPQSRQSHDAAMKILRDCFGRSSPDRYGLIFHCDMQNQFWWGILLRTPSWNLLKSSWHWSCWFSISF